MNANVNVYVYEGNLMDKTRDKIITNFQQYAEDNKPRDSDREYDILSTQPKIE